jgi:predicted  nucleic acid-binding Zn-ribbon protein
MRSLQSQLTSLQADVRLVSLRDRIEDLQTTVNNLDQEIAGLRARGNAFNKGLEAQVKDFAQQWRTLRPGVARQIEAQAKSQQASLRPIEYQNT